MRVFYFAKVELFRNKAIGWFLRGVHAFPVNRGKADRHAWKQSQDILKRGDQLIFFPEGTRSKDGEVQSGQPGMARLAFATGAPVADHAMAVRFKLYEAGWQAFEQSPLFGHGWARLMSSVEPFLAGADKTYAKLPHLHNEVLNFAVFGGVAGVAIYLVLIAMPIIIALRSRRDGQYRARLAGTGILALGYVVMGLPDTMLSFDLHTALYVALVATLLGYCRDEREPEAA